MQRTLGIDGARTCGGPTSEQLQAEATITKHPTPPVFKYEALEPDAIRLLKWCTGSKAVDPHFELVTSRYLPHTQKYDVPYNALSYCWGHATHPKNLWSALQSIVYPEKLEMRRSGLLWIDAICINQQDIEERSSQVQQMWRIFNNATVIAWLGDSNEQVYASYFQCISQCDWPPKLRTSMEPAMKDILARQYFSRAWIAPELTQASRVDFLCGNRAHWSHEALSSLADQLAKESLGTNEVRSANLIRSAALGNRFEEEGNDAGSIFNRVFEAFYEAGCTDRRDRIFAMLQDPRIRRLSLSLKPDYSLSENDLWLALGQACGEDDAIREDAIKGTGC
ncbi:hypothetical protein DOTSEDRAFT_32616 [Dothistroma septosporum NZE10]|uniref:Heterokaryon incompatibility domain-containing protein n=1 Tax=Dothistroma septosporum (strain NZE10 / CBS 128990) TaxID=675120 RepID=N1PR91_DOTSN|nr:hypothetical protein DOTSEDRAFT_32616 [Dothistroma septosporum NZE10]